MKPARIFLFIATLSVAGLASAGLREYVNKPDDTYAFEVLNTQTIGTNTVYSVLLTSQTWQGIVWKHWLTIIRPEEVLYPEKSLLFIDGGDNTDTPPGLEDSESKAMLMIANGTKSVLSILNQVPNQPLFGGKKEDEIIAYTEVQWIQTGDDSWPLLFPMVKSAVRAMDTLQTLMAEKHGQKIEQFVLTGGSKRGWTSWLTAAADARVCAIAPVVIDVLNMQPQMEFQMAVYGGYSEEVSEYTEYKLQEMMATPKGQQLLSMMDPYAYRGILTLPKLVVLGTNDPYWTVDAANFYFPGLTGEKHLYYQANTPHDANLQGVATIAEFYLRQLKNDAFPKLAWDQPNPNTLDLAWNVAGGELLLWTAQSDNRDFRRAKWSSQPVASDGERATVTVPTPETGWTAYYVELRMPGSLGMPFGSTTKMTVVPDTLPTTGRTYEAGAAVSLPTAAGERETAHK